MRFARAKEKLDGKLRQPDGRGAGTWAKTGACVGVKTGAFAWVKRGACVWVKRELCYLRHPDGRGAGIICHIWVKIGLSIWVKTGLIVWVKPGLIVWVKPGSIVWVKPGLIVWEKTGLIVWVKSWLMWRCMRVKAILGSVERAQLVLLGDGNAQVSGEVEVLGEDWQDLKPAQRRAMRSSLQVREREAGESGREGARRGRACLATGPCSGSRCR